MHVLVSLHNQWIKVSLFSVNLYTTVESGLNWGTLVFVARIDMDCLMHLIWCRDIQRFERCKTPIYNQIMPTNISSII